jgi:hypothetical protein
VEICGGDRGQKEYMRVAFLDSLMTRRQDDEA